MQLLRESMILHKLNHRSIVKFYGINLHSFKDSNSLNPTILTEYLPNKSLKEILDKEKRSQANGEWTPTKRYICLLGIADAMHYLHQNGVIHRDLKPQNVLIDSDYYPRICDFGLSKCFSESLSESIQISTTGVAGTPMYTAPELYDDDPRFGPGTDVYAFSILAYEVVSNCQPFEDCRSPAEIINKITEGGRPTFPDGVTSKMKDLISRCWDQNPRNRPSFEEIFNELANDFSYSFESLDEEEVQVYLDFLNEDKLANSSSVTFKSRENENVFKIKAENKQLFNKSIKLEDEKKALRSLNFQVQDENKELKDENEELKKN